MQERQSSLEPHTCSLRCGTRPQMLVCVATARSRFSTAPGKRDTDSAALSEAGSVFQLAMVPMMSWSSWVCPQLRTQSMITLHVSCQFAGLIDGEASADAQRCRLHDAAFLEGAPAGRWRARLGYQTQGPWRHRAPAHHV